jgi:hypothetical protein
MDMGPCTVDRRHERRKIVFPTFQQTEMVAIANEMAGVGVSHQRGQSK